MSTHDKEEEHHCGCDHHHHHDEDSDSDSDVEYEFDENYLASMREQLPPEKKTLTVLEQNDYIKQVMLTYLTKHREHQKMTKLHEQYKKDVRENYKFLHPDLQTLKKSFFVESFWNTVFPSANIQTDATSFKSILQEVHPGIFSFEMLTPEFCTKLLEEIQHFEKWCLDHNMTVFRPNSMNNYGAILDDFGFDDIMQEWVDKLVSPFAKLLFPSFVKEGLDSHHAFVVEYKIGKDEKLDFHVDDSEVTLNVCLGKTFTGGTLFFRGIRCIEHQQDDAEPNEIFDFQHNLGKAILHVGKHRHGANKILSGERFNLILWCRSSSLRHTKEYHSHFDLCGHPFLN